MLVRVHLLAFGGSYNDVRVVEIPSKEMTGDQDKDLDVIFKYGQNDFQPRERRSVSVGDVIYHNDMYYRVESCGFKQIYPIEA